MCYANMIAGNLYMNSKAPTDVCAWVIWTALNTPHASIPSYTDERHPITLYDFAYFWKKLFNPDPPFYLVVFCMSHLTAGSPL